ncbi:hypothetical protein JCM11641_006135 [Rhodosporidiobolus odoratus]
MPSFSFFAKLFRRSSTSTKVKATKSPTSRGVSYPDILAHPERYNLSDAIDLCVTTTLTRFGLEEAPMDKRVMRSGQAAQQRRCDESAQATGVSFESAKVAAASPTSSPKASTAVWTMPFWPPASRQTCHTSVAVPLWLSPRPSLHRSHPHSPDQALPPSFARAPNSAFLQRNEEESRKADLLVLQLEAESAQREAKQAQQELARQHSAFVDDSESDDEGSDLGCILGRAEQVTVRVPRL